ncbi:MAG: hypothetical protein LC746_09315 [Acidobacteria bacterium]|nr:hypothetical protein [Acidobacteriota bacterium]
MSYFVFTEENEHYMDEGARRRHGEYETREEALAAARMIVDSDLRAMYRPGMSAESLCLSYRRYGTDAYVVPDDEQDRFSAWDYAGDRSREICRAGRGNDEG